MVYQGNHPHLSSKPFILFSTSPLAVNKIIGTFDFFLISFVKLITVNTWHHDI